MNGVHLHVLHHAMLLVQKMNRHHLIRIAVDEPTPPPPTVTAYVVALTGNADPGPCPERLVLKPPAPPPPPVATTSTTSTTTSNYKILNSAWIFSGSCITYNKCARSCKDMCSIICSTNFIITNNATTC